MDLRCLWVDLGSILGGYGVDLGWILGGSYVYLGRYWVDLRWILGASGSSKEFHGVNGFPWSQRIFVKSMFLRQNANQRSKFVKIAKNYVLHFLHFYPLISAFQALSRMANARS